MGREWTEKHIIELIKKHGGSESIDKKGLITVTYPLCVNNLSNGTYVSSSIEDYPLPQLRVAQDFDYTEAGTERISCMLRGASASSMGYRSLKYIQIAYINQFVRFANYKLRFNWYSVDRNFFIAVAPTSRFNKEDGSGSSGSVGINQLPYMFGYKDLPSNLIVKCAVRMSNGDIEHIVIETDKFYCQLPLQLTVRENFRFDMGNGLNGDTTDYLDEGGVRIPISPIMRLVYQEMLNRGYSDSDEFSSVYNLETTTFPKDIDILKIGE